MGPILPCKFSDSAKPRATTSDEVPDRHGSWGSDKVPDHLLLADLGLGGRNGEGEDREGAAWQ